MSAKFEPVRIKDLLEEETEQSPTASGLRLFYFQLSASPSREWIQLFEQQRTIPRYRNLLGGREAKVRGNYIVVDCAPDELEKQHEILKHDVGVANNDYQEYLVRVETQVAREAQARNAELEKIQSIKSRLKFE